MVFRVPLDSLSHRYPEAYREKSWEGVRTTSGLKVLPKIRTQLGPTCMYDATTTWMEVQLRMIGIECRLSSKDLQIKEQKLNSEHKDRVVRCMIVIKTEGLISEDDFRSQNPNPTRYKLKRVKYFFSLFEPDFAEAVRRMDANPLLLVFHVGSNYDLYIKKFFQRPILSYERYEEGKMSSHAVCVIGYGTESIVPFWKFMNSYGKQPATRGLGRVIPQNAMYLIAPEPGYLEITRPEEESLEAAAPLPVAEESVAHPQSPSAPHGARINGGRRKRQELAEEPAATDGMPSSAQQSRTNGGTRKRGREMIGRDDTDARVLKKEKPVRDF